MSILSNLQNDAKQAMRDRESEKVANLRLLINAIQNEAKAAGTDDLDDDEAIAVLMRERKKSLDAAEAFEGGGAADRAAAERRQIELIDHYLPEQLSDDELADIVTEAITQSGASSPSEMGAVMKLVMPRVKGRADGKVVSQAVSKRLAGLSS